jgi:hypothetical protein
VIAPAARPNRAADTIGPAAYPTAPAARVITVALGPSLAVGGEGHDPDPNTTNTDTERRTAVKHETNGHAPAGRHNPPAEAPDPLAAAEELRAALADAAMKAARLVAALRADKKDRKALASVYAGLKRLNLDQP